MTLHNDTNAEWHKLFEPILKAYLTARGWTTWDHARDRLWQRPGYQGGDIRYTFAEALHIQTATDWPERNR